MYDNSSAIYGLKHPCRALCAHMTKTESHHFIVGTSSVREQNEIHIVEFDEEDNQIKKKAVFDYDSEVLSLVSCPFDENSLFVTTLKPSGEDALFLHGGIDVSNEGDEETHHKLMTLHELKGHTSPLVDMQCYPLADLSCGAGDKKCVTIEHNGIHHWNVAGTPAILSSTKGFGSAEKPILAGCWDPHHPNNFVVVKGCDVHLCDLRNLSSLTDAIQISNAHNDTILSVDYNPNKPFHIVTAGEDRLAKLFDIRKPTQPLKILGGHTHWITTVSYNRYHDQLLLTSSTDSTVNLWSIVSASSAPLGELEDPQNEKDGDKLVKTYDSHEESVMNSTWSCYDAWVFASLSYDGRLVVNHVPSTEKYKILL